MREFEFNPKYFSPLHWHLMPLLADPKIRFIFVEGGSSAAKTFEVCRALLMDQMRRNYSSLVFRRFHVHIKDSVYSSFKVAAKSIEFDNYYHFQQDLIHCGSRRIRFRGLDDEENIKGIEDFDVVYNNEWSQFLETHWDQQRKRLRGRPNQKFICDWNPVSSKLWQYENYLDKDEWIDLPLDMPDAPAKFTALDPEHAFKRINRKGNSIWLKVTYRDNFWIVGHPSGSGGYLDQATLDDFEYDRIHKPNLYRIYANGERGIMRTGGEFFKQFDEMKHVGPVQIRPGVLHITLDNNVVPYVTISIWQIIEKQLTQVREIASKEPDNNAPRSARKLISWLQSISYSEVLFIYGDPSANARSTVDENSSSFFQKFIGELTATGYKIQSRVQLSHPQVAMSAAFINDIYELNLGGWSILIGDNCKVSIDDYASVKEDENGNMLKVRVKDKNTGQTYEEHGHFSDAKRYFVVSVLKSLFEAYKARKKSNIKSQLSYFK